MGARRRRQEATPREGGSSLDTDKSVDEAVGQRAARGGGHDGGGIDDRAVRVLGRPEGLDDLARVRRHVGDVHDAGVHLAARDVVERLPDVLGEHQAWAACASQSPSAP